MSSDDVIFQ